MSQRLLGRGSGTIAIRSCFVSVKWAAAVKTNMITRPARAASLQEESRLTPSQSAPRRRMDEITRTKTGAIYPSLSLPALVLAVGRLVDQQREQADAAELDGREQDQEDAPCEAGFRAHAASSQGKCRACWVPRPADGGSVAASANFAPRQHRGSGSPPPDW